MFTSKYLQFSCDFLLNLIIENHCLFLLIADFPNGGKTGLSYLNFSCFGK